MANVRTPPQARVAGIAKLGRSDLPIRTEFVEARTNNELRISLIWSEVLNFDRLRGRLFRPRRRLIAGDRDIPGTRALVRH